MDYTKVKQAELARLLGLTPAAIVKYRKAGCPATREGNHWFYSMPELVQWLCARAQRKQAEQAAGLEARTRLMRAKADLAEIKLAELRENLVSVAEADAVWEKMARRWTARIKQIIPAGAVVSGMRPAEATSYLKSVVYQALTDMANEP